MKKVDLIGKRQDSVLVQKAQLNKRRHMDRGWEHGSELLSNLLSSKSWKAAAVWTNIGSLESRRLFLAHTENQVVFEISSYLKILGFGVPNTSDIRVQLEPSGSAHSARIIPSKIR